MRTVRDASGRRYVLLKESADSSLVRDPATGEERYVPNDRLDPVEGESPLDAAARSVPEPIRRVLSAVPDDRALGLLVEIDARGPLAVRDLLEYDLCESDIHGLVGELRAAGLIDEVDIDGIETQGIESEGERGYETTDTATEALDRLRDA